MTAGKLVVRCVYNSNNYYDKPSTVPIVAVTSGQLHVYLIGFG